MERQFGVHSEVGKLRTVLVCRPGLAHQRLTPGNCRDLLFDDVLWVHEARKDHFDFVLKMRERGIEVLELHELLGQTLESTEARRWLLDRRITPNSVGRVTAMAIRPWLDAMPAPALADHLIGGIAMEDLPKSESSALLLEVLGGTSFLIPPIPNTLFQRDPSCWIYDGVSCNQMFWPARKPETLLQRAVYKFHPVFKDGKFNIWFGDSDEDFTGASIEGGDVMPIGKGIVLIGMGERTTHQAVGQLVHQLFSRNAANRVIACVMPKSRAAMHLDTVFSFCDRDACKSDDVVAVVPLLAFGLPGIASRLDGPQCLESKGIFHDVEQRLVVRALSCWRSTRITSTSKTRMCAHEQGVRAAKSL